MHDFNPHGISARPDLNLMVTSDFMMPASSLNVVPGDPLLRGIIRVWDLQNRSIVRTIAIPTALGTMDVKLIPRDPLGRAFTAGMFDGFVYLVDTMNGTAQAVFDCETIVPHVEVPVRGGMTQLMAMPRSGDRLIFGLFQAGQVGMLDVSDPEHPVQAGIVSLGKDAGPHMVALTDDDKRLVVSDYFLNEDDFGKIHFEGDHHVRVIKVFKKRLALDRRFDVDFNTAFATGTGAAARGRDEVSAGDLESDGRTGRGGRRQEMTMTTRTRREFLREVAVGSSATFLAAHRSPLAVSHASPPPPWASQIGLELYTVRDLLASDYEGTLAKVAAMGYTEVEPTSYNDMAPREFRALLDRYKLSMPSTHAPARGSGADLEKQLEGFQIMGIKYTEIQAVDQARGAARRRPIRDGRPRSLQEATSTPAPDEYAIRSRKPKRSVRIRCRVLSTRPNAAPRS